MSGHTVGGIVRADRDSRSVVRWIARLAAVVSTLALLSLMTVMGAVLFPRTDTPGRADAVVVLGPSTPHRVGDAMAIMRSGGAKALVVSARPADTGGIPPAVCRSKQAFPVFCFDPSPPTTRGEARAVEALARQHGWRSVQIITFPPHIERARLIMGRCLAVDARYLPSTEDFDETYQLVYHTAAFYKAFLSPGC